MSFTALVEQVGPGTPAGTILRRYWQPVAVAAQLPVGGTQPLRILGEAFTLYRDERGAAHVVGARCAHRGTFLHTGWVEDDCIRCFYHGWKFEPSGQCVEQPAEPAGFARAVRIPSHPVEEYAGLVFAFFGEGAPPPLPRFPELEAPGIKVVAGIRPPGPWPVNYFQVLENSVDPVHLCFVHRATQPFTRVIPEVRAERSGDGVAMTAVRDGVERHTKYWFPHLIQLPLWPIPGERIECPFFNWKVPVDDGHTLFIAATAVPEHLADRVDDEEIGGRTMEAAAGPGLLAGDRRPASVTEEDYVAIVGQGTFADRVGERLGRSDVGVIELRRLWQEHLDALAGVAP
ncbi:MAG: Rieske 2Fe-2S domain-containing protein [Actinomycetota bacterium]|nr:Rieske 2Fe-2S domain-containing protein [Acidimicrobiia bacterium]MDQ3293166.1 Rieske 2Fe-2S domain-containing protein [Actinomycetota bacterium]